LMVRLNVPVRGGMVTWKLLAENRPMETFWRVGKAVPPLEIEVRFFFFYNVWKVSLNK